MKIAEIEKVKVDMKKKKIEWTGNNKKEITELKSEYLRLIDALIYSGMLKLENVSIV